MHIPVSLPDVLNTNVWCACGIDAEIASGRDRLGRTLLTAHPKGTASGMVALSTAPAACMIWTSGGGGLCAVGVSDCRFAS